MAHTFVVANRRAIRWVASATLGLFAAAALVLASAGSASAHVTVKPGEVEGGGFTEVAFAVPNERDDASTTQLRVVLPADQPLASVQTTPIPGWTITTKERKLSEPIDFFGSDVTNVVSEIHWEASGEGISPGQFVDFPVSLGVLPTSGTMTFKAVQTYSSGEVVRWDQVAVGDAEPEHPAPVLTLTAPADDSSSESTAASDADEESDDDDTGATIGLVLSVVALVLSIAAVGLAWMRPRS